MVLESGCWDVSYGFVSRNGRHNIVLGAAWKSDYPFKRLFFLKMADSCVLCIEVVIAFCGSNYMNQYNNSVLSLFGETIQRFV